MGVDTKIEWTDHTFNGWIGCTRYGEGCRNCYAEAQNKHWKWNGGDWGPGALRKVTSPSKWREPLKWNRDAEAAGERRKVFAFSLGDWADAEGPEGALPWLWELWRLTPWLDWQMLTKRAERIAECLPPDWGKGYPNVWLGYSVACQEDADRGIPPLLRVPAVVRFLSCEPLVGPVDLTRLNASHLPGFHGCVVNAIDKRIGPSGRPFEHIDWVIVGGESGHGARPMDLAWARSIVAQCKAAGVACFVKQLGAVPRPSSGVIGLWRLKDRKGGDIQEWSDDLRVREFPALAGGTP
jgi:protein gp37